jgi:hypothetical protein
MWVSLGVLVADYIERLQNTGITHARDEMRVPLICKSVPGAQPLHLKPHQSIAFRKVFGRRSGTEADRISLRHRTAFWQQLKNRTSSVFVCLNIKEDPNHNRCGRRRRARF